MTRGKENFYKAAHAVSLFKKLGVKTTIKCTLTSDNISYASDLKNLFGKEVSCEYTSILPFGRANTYSKFITPKQLYRFTKDIDDKLSYKKRNKRSCCWAGLKNISISATGDVYPCQMLHFPEFTIGNALIEDIPAILKSTKNQEFLEQISVNNSRSACRKCAVRYICGGGCKANAYAGYGSLLRVRFLCEYIFATSIDSLVRE